MSVVLLAHVVFGSVAVLAGLLAMVATKGGLLHRRSGRAYVLSMLLMALAGAVVAVERAQAINLIAASLTIYLVLTSAHAAGAKTLGRQRFEVVACIGICSVLAAAVICGYLAMRSANASLHGYHYGAYFFMGTMALVASVYDIRLLVRDNADGQARIARHIWRMSLSYFIAVGSLFSGPGASVFPTLLQDSGLLSLPEPMVLVFMIYWLVRNRRLGRAGTPITDPKPQ